MNFRNLIFTIILTTLVNHIIAQDLKPGQHIFYRDGFNPASFVQQNDVNLFLLSNFQYVGFESEPSLHLVDYSMNLNGHKVGFLMKNDVIGYDKTQHLMIRYAKKFMLSGQASFSLGLAAGALHRRLEATKMTFEMENDPMSLYDIANTSFDFDIGAEIQMNGFTAGISSTHFSKLFSNPEFLSPLAHIYGYAEYVFGAGNELVYYPNVLFRLWNNTLLAEPGMMAKFRNKIWLGMSYTSEHDFAVSASGRISQNIMFGFAYITSMNTEILRPFQLNSRELFISFAFQQKRNASIRSVRLVD